MLQFYLERFVMKKEIHPEYKEVKVTCSCGNTFTTKSTLNNDKLNIEICSKCHPFYTGQQKLVDTAGRVDKFKKKYGNKKK
jgi:large subunit ribosomal protein L31